MINTLSSRSLQVVIFRVSYIHIFRFDSGQITNSIWRFNEKRIAYTRNRNLYAINYCTQILVLVFTLVATR